MVLLTMTTSIVEALEKIQVLERMPDEGGANIEGKPQIQHGTVQQPGTKAIQQAAENAPICTRASLPGQSAGTNKDSNPTQPDLLNPKIGNPISHGQIIDLSSQMKAQKLHPCRLEELLKSSRLYIPPPPPKQETVGARLPLVERYLIMTRPPNTKP
jgi:hypothetical protein